MSKDSKHRFKCPVCSDLIPIETISQHFELELQKFPQFDEFESTETHKSAGNLRESKRDAAKSAKLAIHQESHEDEILDSVEQVLAKVWKDKNVRSKKYTKLAKPIKKPRVPDVQEPIVCPMCNQQLPLDDASLSQHIDTCLAANRQQPLDSNFVEYRWGGESRVRATALMESFNVVGWTRGTKSEDENEEVDIDNEEDFGKAQYSDKDLKPKQETTDPSLIIENLKSKIKLLEQGGLKQKCVICMDSFKDPVTSITCWHVFCEACWLDSLNSKRLCPICQKIVSPSDLRRIYL